MKHLSLKILTANDWRTTQSEQDVKKIQKVKKRNNQGMELIVEELELAVRALVDVELADVDLTAEEEPGDLAAEQSEKPPDSFRWDRESPPSGALPICS